MSHRTCTVPFLIYFCFVVVVDDVCTYERRDWFQLTLKEGLTVFRDQLFSADMGSHAAKRIEVPSHARSSTRIPRAQKADAATEGWLQRSRMP